MITKQILQQMLIDKARGIILPVYEYKGVNKNRQYKPDKIVLGSDIS